MSCAEGETGHVYAGTMPFEVVDASILPSLAAAAHARSWSISAIPSSPSRRRCGPTTASVWRAWNSSSATTSASIRWRWPARTRSPRPSRSRAIARLTRAYAEPVGLLRRAAVGRHRHDRRGLLSQAGDRAALRLQDQRVRQADRRRRLRAQGREPDAGLSRRRPLRPSRLRARASRWNARHCAACARRWASSNVEIMVPFCRRGRGGARA